MKGLCRILVWLIGNTTSGEKAISTLPEKYRAPLVLRDVEGKSYDEIARYSAREGNKRASIARGIFCARRCAIMFRW